MKTIYLFLLLLFSTFTVLADYKVTDFGAVANDGQSDAAAIRAAVSTAEKDCGGTIIFPKGKYLIDSPVTSTYSNCPFAPTTWKGEVGSEIVVSVGQYNPGLVFSWMPFLKIENITFMGLNVGPSDPKFIDAQSVLVISVVENVILDNVRFYGFAVTKSLVQNTSSTVVITNSQFSGNSSYYNPNWELNGAHILGDNDGFGNVWTSLTIRNSQFMDYANYRGNFISKQSHYMTGNYIRVKPFTPAGAARNLSRLTVENCVFDEGAHTPIYADGTEYVTVSGIGINMNGTTGSTGVRLRNVKLAKISESTGDWGNNGRPFFTTQNVGLLKISGLVLRSNITFLDNQGNTSVQIEYCQSC